MRTYWKAVDSQYVTVSSIDGVFTDLACVGDKWFAHKQYNIQAVERYQIPDSAMLLESNKLLEKLLTKSVK